MNARALRRAEAVRKQINDALTECCLYLAAIGFITVWLMFTNSESCNEPIKGWCLGSLLAYIIQLITAMYGYHYLKVWNTMNLKVFFGSGGISILYTAWLIWGNSMYYDEKNDCNTKAPDLMILQCILIIFGYFDMMKCLIFSCIGSCFLAFWVRDRRNGGHANMNWLPAPTQFLKKLVSKKFDPSKENPFDSCIICMVEYSENDEITTLPCDDKHYFHPECIKGWLKKNNSCPLCKKPVTM
jgi:hypothetical protein